MLRAPAIVCLIFAVTAFCIPPSPDFNITNFVGHWNAVGLFSTNDLGIQFYSCATLDVTLGTLSKLTLAFNYINTETNKYVQSSEVVVPSPLNKAILISTTSPTPQNNFVVTYYNSTSGEAVIINSALTFGYILARDENPLTNNFQTLASQILTNLTIPLNNVTFIFNRNCDIKYLRALPNFDASKLRGVLFGNAVFTTVPLFQDLECFTSKFVASDNNLIDVATNFTFSNGKIIYSEFNYYPMPQLTSVLENTQIKNVPPFVIIYQDTQSSTFVAATGDSSKAFVFSAQSSLSQDILSQVEQALNINGMVVSSSTFYQLSATCEISVEQQLIA